MENHFLLGLFSIWVFFQDQSWVTALQGKGEGISLTRHYYFHPLQKNKNKKNLKTPLYGWGSTASRQEPFRGGSLLITIKFPEILGCHFIDLGRMSRPWSHPMFWTQEPLDWKSSTLTTRPLIHQRPLLYRHLRISRAITAEGSPLHIGSSRTRTGNLWFPSASR